jgi:hypothetical protein
MEEDTPSCVLWKNTTMAVRMHGMMKDRVSGLHLVPLLEDSFRLWSLVAPLVFIIILGGEDGRRVQAVEEMFVFLVSLLDSKNFILNLMLIGKPMLQFDRECG